jgi:hypothetical protein
MALLLSGCAQGGTGINILDTPPADKDALPADFDSSAIQPDSARYAAEHEGISYFLAKPVEPAAAAAVCIVVVEPGMIGCGGAPEATVGFGGGEAQTVRDGDDVTELTDQGWTQIHDNLLVR